MFYLLLPPNFTPTISIYAEDRERFERHINPGFSGPADANRSDLYSRLRVGLYGSISKEWSAKVEYQERSRPLLDGEAEREHREQRRLPCLRRLHEDSTIDVTAGRQKITLNSQRLIGTTEWLNMARSLDAARAQAGSWDLWGGGIGTANTEPRTARVGALTRHDDRWGTGSVIFKHDVAPNGDIDIQTYDYYISRPFAGNTLDGESALQLGNDNGKDQEAWAFHARAKRTILPKTTC